jgi:hypothetical protein
VLEQDVYNLNGSLFPNGTSYQNLAGQTTDAATPAKSTYYQGNIIYGIDWTQLVAKYNVAAHDCICNSDCACNNVCACHNDCGCNYSDERLKKNIQFVENKQGLNLYSYNYIWDSATTYIGIMAQQLIGTKYESALSKDNKGYYMVDYSKLPVAMSVSA